MGNVSTIDDDDIESDELAEMYKRTPTRAMTLALGGATNTPPPPMYNPPVTYTPTYYTPQPTRTRFERFKPMDPRNWAPLRINNTNAGRKPFVRQDENSYCDIDILVRSIGHTSDFGTLYCLNKHMYGYFNVARAQEVVNYLIDRSSAVHCIYLLDKKGRGIVANSKLMWLSFTDVQRIISKVEKGKDKVVLVDHTEFKINFEQELGHYGINNNADIEFNFFVTSTRYHMIVGLYKKSVDQGRVAVPVCGLAVFLHTLGY